MFFTRTFFKLRALRFIPPDEVDEDFYADTKDRLIEYPNLKFESEINFWQTYRGIFIVSVLYAACFIWLAVFFLNASEPIHWTLGLPLFLTIVLLRPAIYFIILMVYYYRYRVNENRFHTEFLNAVAGSKDFNEFRKRFYTGRYADQSDLREFQYEGDIHIIKNFVKYRGLNQFIAIYKYSRPPFKFVILSTSEGINEFLEKLDGAHSLKADHPIRWVIKNQTEVPCMFGNKRLKELMDLS